MAGKSSPGGGPAGASVSPPEAGAGPRRPPLARLKKRRDFLKAAKARKWASAAFILQARRRTEEERAEGGDARVGFTASKKVGGAVARNRAKRRLRALATEALAPVARDGWDYVLIARADSTVRACFAEMRDELAAAVEKVHAERGARPRARGGDRPGRGGRRAAGDPVETPSEAEDGRAKGRAG